MKTESLLIKQRDAGKRKCYRDAAVELAHELVRTLKKYLFFSFYVSFKVLLFVKGGKKIGPCLWRREYWFDAFECLLHVEPQITGETVGEVRPVANMHQRKAEMARHSDCFIALPGPNSHLQSTRTFPPVDRVLTFDLVVGFQVGVRACA
ncbi:hypothetical protein GQ457_18G025820 [Hibiscus cannabinus]